MIEIKEPFPDWAWPLAWAWLDGARRQALDDFGPKTAAEFVEYSLRAYARTFGIWKDGSVAGAVGVERNSPAVVTVHILLSRRAWGIPSAELRSIAAELFDSEKRLQRIHAFVPAWNRLAIALCRRLGAKAEGTMRAATLRGGKPADAVVFALTREDFFNGTELRRIDGRDELELVEQLERNESVDLLAGPEQPAVDAGAVLPELDSFFELGVAEHDNAGGNDTNCGPDKQELRGGRKHAPAAARGARVRSERTKRTDHAPNGARKRGRAGGKSRGGRKQPDSAKSKQPA